jgi:hypothetical protein
VTTFQKEILRLLAQLNDKLNEQGERLEDVQGVLVSTAEDVSTLRSRQIEQASRDGQVQHQHQRAIQDLEGRVRKLEVA